MWRPKNWKIPQHYIGLIDDRQQDAFEAGADAMLEALRTIGFYITRGQILEVAGKKIKATKNQTLALIPDEEK